MESQNCPMINSRLETLVELDGARVLDGVEDELVGLVDEEDAGRHCE